VKTTLYLGAFHPQLAFDPVQEILSSGFIFTIFMENVKIDLDMPTNFKF